MIGEQIMIEELRNNIRELEAGLIENQDLIIKILEVIHKYELEKPTGLMVKAYLEIVDILVVDKQ